MKFLLIISLLAITQLLPAQTNLKGNDIPHIQNKRIKFTPTSFHRSFSSKITPALTINAGDTVNTESIDAGGYDKNGIKRSEKGNPLTGPFYIEGALEGMLLQ